MISGTLQTSFGTLKRSQVWSLSFWFSIQNLGNTCTRRLMSWQKILTIGGSSPEPTRQPIQYHLMSSGARHHTGEWLRRPTVPTCSPLRTVVMMSSWLLFLSHTTSLVKSLPKKKEIDTLSQEGYWTFSTDMRGEHLNRPYWKGLLKTNSLGALSVLTRQGLQRIVLRIRELNPLDFGQSHLS